MIPLHVHVGAITPSRFQANPVASTRKNGHVDTYPPIRNNPEIIYR